MRVLLISTYELGHQPLHVASPAAKLRRAGHDVRCLDLSLEPLDGDAIAAADAVALSVPMHTAMRLALRAAEAIRDDRPGLPICLYGLYAPVSADLTLGAVADRVIAGEYEPALVAWVDALANGAPPGTGADQPIIQLGRGDFDLPARDLLPPLERYARLAIGTDERVVGYVEASHGCVHKCRHCPLPAVYDGRIRIVSQETVIADIEQLVELGARHITFGDPDFLNGRRHSLAVVGEMHRRFPELTFDCTTKVEHILENAGIWPELARAGCLFVVTALESVNDEILERLDKGHTMEQARAAIALLREHGIEPRPSFMPFTPWSRCADIADILEFVEANDMVHNVDPVQYTIRLLVPEGSLLLARDDMRPYLEAYDAERLSWTWHAADPAADRLQKEIAALVERSVAAGEDAAETFVAVRELARSAAGLAPGEGPAPAAPATARPRLTEPWFCCAEPTEGQLSPLECANRPVGQPG